jgi:GNAT superfamily N-acetyltransferase
MSDIGANARARPVVRLLTEQDLPAARRIFRRAFGTFLGAPDPETFWSDRDYIYGRQSAPHVASFAATVDGELAGSNFATNWGSVGFFGPLTISPEVQERGIARALLARTVEQFGIWQTRHAGLFTFAQSAKHIALYQKYGFYARFLTAVMSRKVNDASAEGWTRFSRLTETEREDALKGCREVTQTIYDGLDLTEEIRTLHKQGTGDTLLLEGSVGIAGFAICHWGQASEAGADTCFVKFGAVRSGVSAERDFLLLLDACEALTAEIGMPTLLVGMNMGRFEAYRALVARGFRTEIQAVAMHRHNDPGYCRPGVYVIDDWR